MKVTIIVMNSVWHDPRVRRTATAAAKEGFETTVIGFNEKANNDQEVEKLPFKTIIVPIQLSEIRSDISIFKKIMREYNKYAAGIKTCIQTSPDVIHANDLDALPIAYFAANKCKSRIIYDTHEIFCENIGIKNSKLKRFVWKTIEKLLIKRVDQVVSVSYAAAEKLAEIYKIPVPTVITNAAVPVDEASLQPKNNKKFEVLLHGKFYEGRGYEEFVRAAALLKDYPDILLVIRGFGQLEEKLHAIAEESNLSNNLVFDPPVLVTEMVSYAARSHVGIAVTEPININFECTVSNKIFEYITAGLPVIMSDVPEHRYLNEKYDFGLILKKNTPECLSEAILKLYKDKELYYRFVKNSIKMRQVLNWNTEVKKLFDIYRNNKIEQL